MYLYVFQWTKLYYSKKFFELSMVFIHRFLLWECCAPFCINSNLLTKKTKLVFDGSMVFLYRFLLWEAVGQKRKWATGVLIFDRSPWRRYGHQFHSLQDRCKCHPHHSLISRSSHSYANYHSFFYEEQNWSLK